MRFMQNESVLQTKNWSEPAKNRFSVALPCTVMVNKENYYQEYKGHTKWLSLISCHFAKNSVFGMTLLHAHSHYICTVCAKYQRASVKTLVQVDFLMYALSKHKHNPYLIGNRKTKLSFCQKIIFWHQTSSHKC